MYHLFLPFRLQFLCSIAASHFASGVIEGSEPNRKEDHEKKKEPKFQIDETIRIVEDYIDSI